MSLIGLIPSQATPKKISPCISEEQGRSAKQYNHTAKPSALEIIAALCQNLF
jgi:hypothetical protein